MSIKKEQIINDLVSSIKSSDAKGTKPYDTTAIVRRVDAKKGIAYVHIPGGVDETPVKLTINAKDGDEVQVRVANGSAFLLGNQSAPPTDDKVANVAKATAEGAEVTAKSAENTAESASTAASQARQIADNTEQHFWFNETGEDTGAHITEVPQDEWNDDTNPNYHKGGNLLARTNGIAVREGLAELASFGATEAIIGAITNRNVHVTSEGLEFYDESKRQGALNYINSTGFVNGRKIELNAVNPNNEDTYSKIVEEIKPAYMASQIDLEASYKKSSTYSAYGRLTVTDSYVIINYYTKNTSTGVVTPTGRITLDGNGDIEAGGTITDGTGNVLSDKADKTSIPETDHGLTAGIQVAANNHTDFTLTFNKTFSSAPNVICSLYSTSTAAAMGSISVSAINITETGCTLRVFNAGSSQRTPAVSWIAIN